jgi:hypothetical protein
MVSSWFPSGFATTGFLFLGAGFVMGVMIALIRDAL